MSESYLFVGGPADGKRIELREARDIILIADADPIKRPAIIKDHIYIGRSFWEEAAEKRIVYFHDSIPQHQSLLALVEGYRQPTGE